MQDEQKKFQEKLSELLSYARDHENKVTMKEVRDFFEDFALDEQKVTFVCEYLTMEQVDVADYEPGVVPEETEKEKKKPKFSEEELRALQQYLDELPETETPSEEETAELYRKAAEGDSLAKSMLVQLWLPKVIETAKEMHTRDFFLMDLVQEGNVGLLVALESVVKAETAEQAIDAAVRETISDFMEEHRVQKHKDNTVVNKVNRLKDAIEELSDGDDMDFSVAELSAYLDMSVEEITWISVWQSFPRILTCPWKRLRIFCGLQAKSRNKRLVFAQKLCELAIKQKQRRKIQWYIILLCGNSNRK